MAMKRAVRDRWCVALRSGIYPQQQAELYSIARDAYCCLGVLQGPVLGHPLLGEDWAPGNSLMAPIAAREAGLPVPRGMPGYAWVAESNLQKQLAELNSEHNFAQIADWIEKNVPVED